jgi:hypothetical protein
VKEHNDEGREGTGSRREMMNVKVEKGRQATDFLEVKAREKST